VSVFVIRLCCLVVSLVLGIVLNLVLLVLSALILRLNIDRSISLSGSNRIAFRVITWGWCVAFVTKSEPPTIGIARSSRLVGGVLPSTRCHLQIVNISLPFCCSSSKVGNKA
jgi:hypothetical protein